MQLAAMVIQIWEAFFLLLCALAQLRHLTKRSAISQNILSYPQKSAVLHCMPIDSTSAWVQQAQCSGGYLNGAAMLMRLISN